ncbi:MAG: lysylphosphatidylglycerol synthase domain-containing protein [Pseudomonas sp.]|nr:lysylphosphatidylglycerol synthase domain-containing protein [Pseudomonas sp.]
MSATRSRPRLKTILAYLMVLASLGYFAYVLHESAADIPAIDWNKVSVSSFLFSCLGTVYTIFATGVMWKILLNDHHDKTSVYKVIQVLAISQIGKYLPGNIGQFVGRVGLAKQAGISYGASAGTILVETLWNLAICAGLALSALVFFMETAEGDPLLTLDPLHLGGAFVVLLVAPWIGIHLLNRFFPALSCKLSAGQLMAQPSWRSATAAVLIYATNFLVLGSILNLHSHGIFELRHADSTAMALMFSAAWIVGYVMPGAPGGLGVREAMIVLLLTPLVGPGAAIGLSVTTRLASIIGDGIAFALGLFSKRYL